MNQYLAKGRARAFSGLKVPETYFERRERSGKLVMNHEIDVGHTFAAYIPQELEGLRKKFGDAILNEQRTLFVQSGDQCKQYSMADLSCFAVFRLTNDGVGSEE